MWHIQQPKKFTSWQRVRAKKKHKEMIVDYTKYFGD